MFCVGVVHLVVVFVLVVFGDFHDVSRGHSLKGQVACQITGFRNIDIGGKG